ncbi:uncharacterized protein EV420DRAFT_1652508 [Desarmillaria tabescens]|uniref:Uncharacterized protein n=1 Tax=Armillaria tabescens TaxID=1929756 RepID=A0AA39MJB8_ARMTA|nr:uncharacterized protein EV420DRAFT_1652508 [Desarmillaria tabescens]KAK0436472.1 hypothetical protein EV420DRAFT_1652508 [Desarmillaria tabescens]
MNEHSPGFSAGASAAENPLVNCTVAVAFPPTWRYSITVLTVISKTDGDFKDSLPASLPPPGPTASPPPVPVEQKKPGPKPWATPEQWTFLEGGVPEYHTTQSAKGKNAAIASFIKDFMPRFWLEFPLEGARSKNGDIKHVREWFQNHRSAKKVKNAARIAGIFVKPRTHALKVEEVYSCNYYVDRVKLLVDQRKVDMTKEVFEVESEVIRNQVLEWTKEQVPLSVMEDGPITPEIAIAAAPDQIKTFMMALSKATGCAMMMIFGGPDPWENGKISTYGFHAGEDEHGRTFGQVFPKFKETYLMLFTRFLQQPQMSSVKDAVDVEMDVGETRQQKLDEEKIMENAEPDDDIDKESHDTGNNIDVSVPAGKELSASDSLLSLSPSSPVPSTEVKAQPPSQVTMPNSHINGDDSHQASEEEKIEEENCARSAEPLDKVPSDKQPSETRTSEPATAASIQTELEEPQPTGTKTCKCQGTWVKDGLTVTQAKRVHSGPAPKEILMLAECAELEGGTIAVPKVPKRRARKT